MAYNPPIGSIYHLYTTYILPSGGLYVTYRLLREPETTIEKSGRKSPEQGSFSTNHQKKTLKCSKNTFFVPLNTKSSSKILRHPHHFHHFRWRLATLPHSPPSWSRWPRRAHGGTQRRRRRGRACGTTRACRSSSNALNSSRFRLRDGGQGWAGGAPEWFCQNLW